LLLRKGITVTADEARAFLRQMDEFDNFELDIVALATIAGGKPHRGGCDNW